MRSDRNINAINIDLLVIKNSKLDKEVHFLELSGLVGHIIPPTKPSWLFVVGREEEHQTGDRSFVESGYSLDSDDLRHAVLSAEDVCYSCHGPDSGKWLVVHDEDNVS